MSTILDVSRFLKFEMISSIKAVFCSLFGWIDSFEVQTTFSSMGILMERGVWLEDR